MGTSFLPDLQSLDAAVYLVPTDTPHCAPNLYAHVGAAVPNLRHVEYFHDHQRIERLFFDGALDPRGGVLTPDPDRPGLGMELRTADAERYRRG
jgi:L-alanine-DL-glutamate epimerase-like enolase superfamily enzyme